MHDDRSPAPVWWILVESITFASLASVARKISGGQAVRLSELLSVLFYSGIGSAITAWVLLPHLPDSPTLLVGVAGLAGVGIAALLDLATALWSAGSICFTWSGRR